MTQLGSPCSFSQLCSLGSARFGPASLPLDWCGPDWLGSACPGRDWPSPARPTSMISFADDTYEFGQTIQTQQLKKLMLLAAGPCESLCAGPLLLLLLPRLSSPSCNSSPSPPYTSQIQPQNSYNPSSSLLYPTDSVPESYNPSSRPLHPTDSAPESLSSPQVVCHMTPDGTRCLQMFLLYDLLRGDQGFCE